MRSSSLVRTAFVCTRILNESPSKLEVNMTRTRTLCSTLDAFPGFSMMGIKHSAIQSTSGGLNL